MSKVSCRASSSAAGRAEVSFAADAAAWSPDTGRPGARRGRAADAAAGRLDQLPRPNAPARFVRDLLRAGEVALDAPCAASLLLFRLLSAAATRSVAGAAAAGLDGETKPDAAPSSPASSRSCDPSREASSSCRSGMMVPVPIRRGRFVTMRCVPNDTSRYDTIRYDTIRYDAIRYVTNGGTSRHVT